VGKNTTEVKTTSKKVSQTKEERRRSSEMVGGKALSKKDCFCRLDSRESWNPTSRKIMVFGVVDREFILVETMRLE
jgi:hypothetical protein